MDSNTQQELPTKNRSNMDGPSVVVEIGDDLFRSRGKRKLGPKLVRGPHATTDAASAAQAELGSLSGYLLNAQEEERRRIARELHDDLSQRAAMIEFALEQVAHFMHEPDGKKALSAARGSLANLAKAIREISHQLHPSIIMDLGLAAAVKQLVNEFNEAGGAAALKLDERVAPMIDPLVGTALYRIAQEALRNARKHAGAVPVRVRLSMTPKDIYLAVQDSGPGFVVEASRSDHGLGLLGMRERARLIGSTLMVRSRPGEGTLIAVRACVRQCKGMIPLLSERTISECGHLSGRQLGKPRGFCKV